MATMENSLITKIFCLLLFIPIIFGCTASSLRPQNVTYARAASVEEARSNHQMSRSRGKRGSIWNNIRIDIVYDKSTMSLNVDKRQLLQELMGFASDYFEDTLKVEREPWLELTPSCDGRSYMDNTGTLVCENDCVPKCGTALSPPGSQMFAKCKCLGKTGCPTDWSQFEGKMRYTDIVVFVTVDASSCADTTLAFASSCSLHPVTKRPVAAHVNICPKLFNAMQKNEVSQWLSALKHELTHAFVFSSSNLVNFIGAKKPTQINPILIIPGIIEKFTRTDWEVAGGQISHDVYMIVTPRVRQEARNHFGCSTLEGAEVENQGGSGTVGTHWEKRVLENEVMSGVSTQVHAYSRITLALFEDSGWYQVNYTQAEEMTWGKGLGCDFVTKSCLTWLKKHDYPFCTRMGDTRCNQNRQSKVRCNIINNPNVPAEYNYNIPNLFRDVNNKSISSVSGLEPIADYCPYYRVFGDNSKEATDTRCTYLGNMNYNNYSLEIFSPNARCFLLDGGVTLNKGFSSTHYYLNAGCYETTCKENRLHVKVQSSKFIPCFYEGQIIYVEKHLLYMGKVEMKIICPACKDICGNNCAPDVYTSKKIGDYINSSSDVTVIFSSFVVVLFFFRHQV